MRNLNFRVFLSVLALYSLTLAATAKAAPVQFNQVVQVVNVKPGKANAGGFTQLRLAGDDLVLTGSDDPKTEAPPVQDDRVITETRSEIVEEEVCDCIEPVGGGFPYWTLGFAAVPLIFLIPPGGGGGDDSPPPTPGLPTPPPPTPEVPVPEPMTILLFGTGLASIGMAARRKFGKKDGEDETVQ